MKIKNIYDNGGKTVDQYTIVFDEEWSVNIAYNMCLNVSTDPDNYMGVSMFGECDDGDHLGKKIDWDDLPENVQEHVERRIKE